MNQALQRDDGVEANAADDAKASIAGVEIFQDGRYRAFAEDLEFMWRWRIHRDGDFLQEGCSLSESSSREAVAHVMAFFARRDLSEAQAVDAGS
jgi:methane monooxygenase component D